MHHFLCRCAKGMHEYCTVGSNNGRNSVYSLFAEVEILNCYLKQGHERISCCGYCLVLQCVGGVDLLTFFAVIECHVCLVMKAIRK